MQDRTRAIREPVAFLFAPGCAFSYLVAERAERTLGEVEWIPMLPLSPPDAASLAVARREALALRLPLETPEHLLADPRPLTRAACLAAEHDVCAKFGLVAARLVFCGGYELDDPQVIVEAAELTGIPVDEALRAAVETRYDLAMEATADGLRQRGIRQTPVVRVGSRWFEGLKALSGAAVAASMPEIAEPFA